MKRIHFVPAALPFVLISLSACGPASSPNPGVTDPAGAIERLSKNGWTLYDKVLSFTPDSLYEQINGRAELYLSYEVTAKKMGLAPIRS